MRFRLIAFRGLLRVATGCAERAPALVATIAGRPRAVASWLETVSAGLATVPSGTAVVGVFLRNITAFLRNIMGELKISPK